MTVNSNKLLIGKKISYKNLHSRRILTSLMEQD